jgi:hypothetical protein
VVTYSLYIQINEQDPRLSAVPEGGRPAVRAEPSVGPRLKLNHNLSVTHSLPRRFSLSEAVSLRALALACDMPGAALTVRGARVVTRRSSMVHRALGWTPQAFDLQRHYRKHCRIAQHLHSLGNDSRRLR